jgi:hypothetical protein
MTIRDLSCNKKGAIMKIKVGPIVGILMLSSQVPLMPASATDLRDPTILRFRLAGDHEVNVAKAIEPPKMVVGSLNVPTLPAESRTEKRSAPSAQPRETLCGLKGVMVFIEDIDSDVEKYGLSKNLLQKEVESRLRHADIPVLTANEAFNMPGRPYLYLNLTTHDTGVELYSYSIRIELNQDVSMIRNPSIKASATTWIANVVGIVGAQNLPAVTEDVTQLTNQFVRDYLAANEK